MSDTPTETRRPMQDVKVGLQQVVKVADRTVTGLFAIHGVRDAGGDISHPGSFSKAIAQYGPAGSKSVRHQWNHDDRQPPIASIKSLREVGRDALPADLLARYPEASGGVEVVREYFKGDLPDLILQGLKSGDINEMSYGYRLAPGGYDYALVDTPGTPETYDWWSDEVIPAGKSKVRNIREIGRLYDTSDVNWGMNEATVASKSGALAVSEGGFAHLVTLVRALKVSPDELRRLAGDVETWAKEAKSLNGLGAGRQAPVSLDDLGLRLKLMGAEP